MTVMSCKLGLTSVAETIIAHACLSILESSIKNSKAPKQLEAFLYPETDMDPSYLAGLRLLLKYIVVGLEAGDQEITDVLLGTDKGREELEQEDMRSERS